MRGGYAGSHAQGPCSAWVHFGRKRSQKSPFFDDEFRCRVRVAEDFLALNTPAYLGVYLVRALWKNSA